MKRQKHHGGPTARHGNAPAPYTKYDKAPHRYTMVPLHRVSQGLPITTANCRRFATRHGIVWPVPKFQSY